MRKEYTVILHQAEEGGYWAEVPSLPGCYSQGETIKETLANLKEAIESHLVALTEDDIELPDEKETIIEKIEIFIK